MKCEKCGTEYMGNFCPNGCNAPAAAKPKKPFFKKWWFWVLIILGVLVFASAGGGGDTTESTKPNTDTSAHQTDTTTAEQTTTQEETTAADNIYEPGESFDANGLQITYVSCARYESSNQFLQPKDGYIYIALKLSAENVSTVDRYISSFEFECYADGVKMDSSYFSENELSGGTLSAGRKTEGFIYFEVPKDAAEIEVEYETSFWTDQKAILKVIL